MSCWCVWMGAVTHCGLILLTVFTPRLSALLQTDAFLQDLSKVVFLYRFFWRAKAKLMYYQQIHNFYLPQVIHTLVSQGYAWGTCKLHMTIHAQQCERVLKTYLESSAQGNAWWRATWGRCGPSPCHSDTGCCSQLHIQTVFRWQTHRRNPENCVK